MAQQMLNTPITTSHYNSRGLITCSFVSKQCFRRPNGELWVILPNRGQTLPIYRSTDNGFSWTQFEDDASTVSSMNAVAGFFHNGPLPSMFISEKYNSVRCIFPDYPGAGTDSDIESSWYILSALESQGSSATRSTMTITTAVSYGTFQIAHCVNECYVGYIDSGVLYIRRASPRTYNSVSTAVSHGSTLTYFLGMCADDQGNVDCLIQHTTGGNNVVKHVRYTESSLTFGSANTINSLGASATNQAEDLDIARDSYGTLCAVWSKIDYGTNECTIQYATSTNSGANWSVTSLSRTSGHSVYMDAIVANQPAGRTSIIGSSSGGFAIMYTEDNSSNVPKTYVRKISTTDGVTYTLGDEYEIGTSNTLATDKVVGGRFFLPIDHQLLDLSDPGILRVAYQVGEGNSSSQSDVKPVDIKQETLNLSAFPSTLASETGSYVWESSDDESIAVSVNVLGGPHDNVDFYALGKTGNYTTKYINAFNKTATSMRLLKYEPNSSRFMNDASAYGAPTEYTANVILDPKSYAFPTRDLDVNDQTTYIEQDIRKIYLPPTMHLSRTLLINKGGYLKRTVWLVEFAGNQYELSQVIPHFLNNQICYYEANAYVVGPSRDPFSRTILPSET
jgi:hypothetical protein